MQLTGADVASITLASASLVTAVDQAIRHRRTRERVSENRRETAALRRQVQAMTEVVGLMSPECRAAFARLWELRFPFGG